MTGQFIQCGIPALCLCSDNRDFIYCNGPDVTILPEFRPTVTRVCKSLVIKDTSITSLKKLDLKPWRALRHLVISGNMFLTNCERLERRIINETKFNNVSLYIKCIDLNTHATELTTEELTSVNIKSTNGITDLYTSHLYKTDVTSRSSIENGDFSSVNTFSVDGSSSNTIDMISTMLPDKDIISNNNTAFILLGIGVVILVVVIAMILLFRKGKMINNYVRHSSESYNNEIYLPTTQKLSSQC